ncbi:MAG: hypothetical protein GY711_00360 [bacterium]|nr:hypothetical protein [bacterium]
MRPIFHFVTPLALFLASVATAQIVEWDTSPPSSPNILGDYAASVAEQGGDNQIFIFASGWFATTPLGVVYRYHPTEYWTELGPMPAPCYGGTSATADNGIGQERIYFFGGVIGTTITNTCWSYDPATDTWNTGLAPMPTPRWHAEAIAAPDGWIYVFGGEESGLIGTPASTAVERYHPATNAWETLDPMPEARTRFGAALTCDGYIYLFGGLPVTSVHHTATAPLASVRPFLPGVGFFDDNPHTASPIPPLPTPRHSQGCTTGRDGKIYNVGGNLGGPDASVEVYDPYGNGWTSAPSLPYPRGGIDAVSLGSRIWAPDGFFFFHPWPWYTAMMDSFGPLPQLPDCIGVVPPAPPATLGALCEISLPFSPGPIYETVVHEIHPGWGDITVDNGEKLQIDFDFRGNDAVVVHLYRGCGGPPIATGQPMAGFAQLEYENQSGMPEELKCEVRYLGNGVDPFVVFDTRTSLRETSIGTNYCGPAVPNSSGNSGVMSASGSPKVHDYDLRIAASGLPQNQFGYFLTSMGQVVVQNPGGSLGHLCIAGSTIGRFSRDVRFTGTSGGFDLDVNLLELPLTPFHQVAPGETWNFQAWFRDISNTSNFTDALQIMFE